MKAYVGKTAQKWTPIRRSVARDLPWTETRGDSEAAGWLLKHGFVFKPQSGWRMAADVLRGIVNKVFLSWLSPSLLGWKYCKYCPRSC